MGDKIVENDGQNGASHDPKGCYYENNRLKFNNYMVITEVALV